VALLEESLIRIGNPEYARRNRSYGLTTLRVRHLDISGSTLHFEFRGKSGKEQEIEVRDRRLARMVQRCQELPGQKLFRYVTETQECCGTVESGDVNDYLREITGQAFTAKDFRTWGGTVVAAAALQELGPAASEAGAQAHIRKAIERAAEALGNTPAVAREYYVHPAILEAYEEGRLGEVWAGVKAPENPQGLTVEEEVVVVLLERRLA
jgi:DNA topoisomerase-1